MWKLLKSRIALSPVVAAIILIAVTVAVSIAVAAWMGALTFTFMSTEQITYTNYLWDNTGSTVDWFVFTVKNTGSSDLSIQDVRVDGIAPLSASYSTQTSTPYTWTSFTTSYLLTKGSSVSFNVTRTGNFAHGTNYEFTVSSTKGNIFGPYTKQAP